MEAFEPPSPAFGLPAARERPVSDGARWRALVLGTLLLLVIALYINFRYVFVDGRSMEPTLHFGQRVLVWKTVPRDRLKVGDVIVFHHLSDGKPLDYIKRIVFIQNAWGTARPPQRVWTPKGEMGFDDLFSDYNLGLSVGSLPPPKPQDTIYVMGDNFQHSEDSRDFGPISPRDILGKMITRSPGPP